MSDNLDINYDLDGIEEYVEFPVGERVDNCKLMGAKYDENKNIVIAFKYEGEGAKNGAILRHREFDPAGNQNADSEKKKKSWEASRSRIHHILGRLMPLEEAREKVKQGDGTGWEKLSNNVINLINTFKGKQCSLKVVYNNKNYPSFPNYPDFMSTTDFPKEFSSNPTYDKYEKQEIASSTPSASTVSASSGDDVEDSF